MRSAEGVSLFRGLTENGNGKLSDVAIAALRSPAKFDLALAVKDQPSYANPDQASSTDKASSEPSPG